MIAFKYHFVILLITLIRVQSASIRREPARETVIDYLYEIRDDPAAPAGAEPEPEVAPGADYDWKKYQEQELIFAPGSADELRVRPDGTATFTQPEVKRYHRTTGNGDDYYVYEYWYPAEEDLPNGLDKVRIRGNNGRASGRIAEATKEPNKRDNLKTLEVTTTKQPERVKQTENMTTTSPKREIAAGQQSASPTTTNPPSPNAAAKLAVVVQSQKNVDALNKPVAPGSSSNQNQDKSIIPAPTTLTAPVKLADASLSTEAVKKKKSVNTPTELTGRSSLEVPAASNVLVERSVQWGPGKHTKLASKVSPVEQANVAPAADAEVSSHGKNTQDSSTTTQKPIQIGPDVAISSASEVESKTLAKRHEAILTTSSEKPFEEVDDLKTTTPNTIIVARNTGSEIVAEVLPYTGESEGKKVGKMAQVNQMKSQMAPSKALEEVPRTTTSPTTTILKAAATTKDIKMTESQKREATTPSLTSSTAKSAVASVAPAETPIFQFGFPEISRREKIAVKQAEAQVPIVKRETGSSSAHSKLAAEVTVVEGEEVEDAPASNIASETTSTVAPAPAKLVEKEDSEEDQEEVEETDQAPASKVSDTAASHVDEDLEGAPTDQDAKDITSKLVKKQTSSHGKHLPGEEVEADEDNMAPGNKAVEESDEEEEEATTPGSKGAAVAPGKSDVGDEEDEETKQVTAVSEEEEDDEVKENVKREDSEASQEVVDDSSKNVAEASSVVKAHAKRSDSGGGGVAEGGDVNQSEGPKRKVVLTDSSPGKVAKATTDEDDEDKDTEEDGGSDDKDDEEEEDEEESNSESPAESLFPHHGKHSTGRKRRDLSDQKNLEEEKLHELLHRSKRSSDMREVVVDDGQKVYVDNPLQFIAPGSSFDGIANGEHLALNSIPRRTRQTGSGYDAFPQNVGSDKFPHAFCDLERDTGIICPGVRRGVFLEQFYYDSETNRCSHFVYNGCGGNANRFSTLWECNQFCGKQNGRFKRMDRQK